MASGLDTNSYALNMPQLLKELNSINKRLSKSQARFLISIMLITTMVCVAFSIDSSQKSNNRANQSVGIPKAKAYENYVVYQDGENYFYRPSGPFDLRTQISKQQYQEYQELRSLRSAIWDYCGAVSGAITMILISVLRWDDAEDVGVD